MIALAVEVSRSFGSAAIGIAATGRGINSTSDLLKYLEPEIAEIADKLHIKLFLLRIDIFNDLAKFVDYLRISPGDKVFLVVSSQDMAFMSNLTKIFMARGAVVYSYVSQKLPQGTFAIGILKKMNI